MDARSTLTVGDRSYEIFRLDGLQASYDVARHFDGFAFSDEVGHSKPHRSMFEEAARQMGVQLEEMVHIGDRDHNDVKGS